jgi:hypothetical protein
MNIRLSLFTAFMVMCNIAAAGTIHHTLVREHAMTKGRMLEEKYDDDKKPHILKEIALVAVYRCMTDERTLGEADAFSKCFEMASSMNGLMGSKQDNALYANALKEIKSLVITTQNQDNTPIEQ